MKNLTPEELASRKKKNKVLLPIVIVLGLLLIGMCNISNDDNPKQTATAGETVNTVPAEETPAAATSAMLVSPSQLVNAYIANEVAADDQFKGKILQITGKIEDIGKDIMDNAYITLTANNEEYRSIQCSFDDNSIVAPLRKGQTVTVIGECKGLMMNVQIGNCVLR